MVLDTSFLIDLERRVPAVLHRYQEVESYGGVLRVPAAVWVEYLYRLPPSKRVQAAQILEDVAVFEPFTRELADIAARLQHERLSEGARLSWHDLQVAATALHYDEELVTNDRGFEAVPGLAVLVY